MIRTDCSNMALIGCQGSYGKEYINIISFGVILLFILLFLDDLQDEVFELATIPSFTLGCPLAHFPLAVSSS